MIYDFSQLNDKEFEILSMDLLSIFFRKKIERFKPGKDSGVDGRFFSDSKQEIIVQCKHYLKSGYRLLISSIKKEAINIKKIKPEQYIFVTSLPLSRNNKKEIKNIFYPYIKIDNNILGQEDLNDLLSSNPKVEEKHFKLWISSTTVFNRILNNAIKGRSEFEIEQIRKRTCKYVPTRSHYEALKILNKNNVLVISGEPGIGKTTLAENLCLQYVSKNYEFFDIEETLSEAENVYKRGEEQLFYFDDFLGSNYFEAIENKKDSHIMKFIERVKNDNTKKFVLTSRTNILNSGILYSSIFSTKKIQKNEFLLTIEKLNDLEKAKILYNHIWFSHLNEDFISEIYKDKRYRDIIKHKNFNPRLIEFITDVDRLTVHSSEYWDYIKRTLDNPRDIWNDCFKNQNNAFVRNIVILTVLNGGQISEDELRNSYYEIIEIENINNISHTENDFESIAQLATKSFLNRHKNSDDENYSLFNPSITDFVLNEYNKNVKKLTDIYKSLNSVKSLETLISLGKGKLISHDVLAKILDELFQYVFIKKKSYDYHIFISYLFKDDVDKKDKIISLLRKIIKSPLLIDEFSKFLNLLSKFEKSLNIANFDFLLKTFKDRYLEHDEIKDLTEFIDSYSIESLNLLNELKEQIESYMSGKLNDITADMDLSLYVDFYEDCDGRVEPNVDEDSVVQKIIDSLQSEINDFNTNLIEKLNFDISDIAGQVYIDDIVSEYLNSIENELAEYDGYGGGYEGFDNDVDDLFEKT